jgi:hypothetical protein
MSKETNLTGGIGLPGILFLVFLVLKLARIGAVAQWSWWWVTAPLWLPLVVILAALVLWFIGYVIYRLIKEIK